MDGHSFSGSCAFCTPGGIGSRDSRDPGATRTNVLFFFMASFCSPGAILTCDASTGEVYVTPAHFTYPPSSAPDPMRRPTRSSPMALLAFPRQALRLLTTPRRSSESRRPSLALRRD